MGFVGVPIPCMVNLVIHPSRVDVIRTCNILELISRLKILLPSLSPLPQGNCATSSNKKLILASHWSVPFQESNVSFLDVIVLSYKCLVSLLIGSEIRGHISSSITLASDVSTLHTSTTTTQNAVHLFLHTYNNNNNENYIRKGRQNWGKVRIDGEKERKRKKVTIYPYLILVNASIHLMRPLFRETTFSFILWGEKPWLVKMISTEENLWKPTKVMLHDSRWTSTW